MSDFPADIFVAGAGITGLGAAHGLKGRSAAVIERRPFVGGMAATRVRDDLRYHAGVHLLHPSSKELQPLIREFVEMMQGDLRTLRPNSKIHFDGRFIPYPFTGMDLLRTLGPSSVGRIGLSAMRSWAGNIVFDRMRNKADSFENVVVRTYGRKLYNLFFRDYTHKVLGVDPSGISGDWARLRVPLPTRSSFLRSMVGLGVGNEVDHSHFPENREQAVGEDGLTSLFERIVSDVKKDVSFHFGTTLNKVHLSDGRVSALSLQDEDGNIARHDCQTLISTIPLTHLIQRLDPPAPPEVLAAAQTLRFRGLIFVFLLVERKRLFDPHWIYFQSPELVFNRVSEFKALVPEYLDGSRTLACFEISAEPGGELWQSADDALVGKTLRDLKTVLPGFSDAEVLDAFVDREDFAYPAWLAGYRDPLATVLNYLDRLGGLITVGRQGRFDYLNLDQCFHAGREAAMSLKEN